MKLDRSAELGEPSKCLSVLAAANVLIFGSHEFVFRVYFNSVGSGYASTTSRCEREGIVGGDEGPVGGVAQVVSHGVKVVGVHGEEGQEKDEEVR